MNFEGERDPDYEEIHVNQQNHLSVKNDVKEATIKRIQSIINNEFNKEIAMKENELDLIEKNLQEAHYVLDQLRTTIISKFYLGEPISSDNSFTTRSEQSWIHPATKKYLGKAPCGTDTPAVSIREHDYSTPFKISTTDVEKPKEIAENNSNNDVEMSSSNMQRVKKTIKIVVGNISKYIPPIEQSQNDQTTHKWMVYFRLKNETIDIKSIVKKVIIFLHPSYKPNDLVEIREPPFYLCRRGWGEFPVRVQVHFQDSQNKPFDIIHNLKLDKTFTGLQTMGGETVEDVSLYLNESVPTTMTELSGESNVNSAPLSSSKKPMNHSVLTGIIKTERVLPSDEHSTTKAQVTDKADTSKQSASFNSCQVVKTEMVIDDTTDSPPPAKKFKSILLPKTTNQTRTVSLLKKNAQNAYRIVMVQPAASTEEVKYFLCSDNSKPVLSKPVSLLSKNSVLNMNVKKESTDSCSTIGYSLWESIEQEHKLLVMRRFSPSLENYSSMREFMVDFIKYFPLCCESPSYPFCTTSFEKFNLWNVGKQRASEWLRAKTIRRILQDLLKGRDFPWAKVIWKPKKILLWCRASGFVPPFYAPIISSCKIGQTQTEERNSVSTILNAVNLVTELEVAKERRQTSGGTDVVEENDPSIDVEIIEENYPLKNSNLTQRHTESDYIKELFLSKPVEESDVIKDIYSTICEEFISDVIHCALFEGAKSQQSKTYSNYVSIDNVYKAILNNSKFDILTNKYLGIESDND